MSKKNRSFKNETAAELSIPKPKDIATSKNEGNFPIETEGPDKKELNFELPKI